MTTKPSCKCGYTPEGKMLKEKLQLHKFLKHYEGKDLSDKKRDLLFKTIDEEIES